MTDLDPTLLPLDELRSLRASLQHDDDAVSYVRRLAQARLDLLAAEIRRRDRHADPAVITSELPVILGNHLTGGPARPPRPAPYPTAARRSPAAPFRPLRLPAALPPPEEPAGAPQEPRRSPTLAALIARCAALARRH